MYTQTKPDETSLIYTTQTGNGAGQF